MNKTRPVKIRDFRNKAFFIVDDAYLNGYARFLGPSASMVYVALCRRADKEQIAFPSHLHIAKSLGITRRTVQEKIKLLERYCFISRKKYRSKKTGKWLNTVYVLLDKSMWKTPPREKTSRGFTVGKKQHRHGKLFPTKDTHIEGYTTTAVVEENVDNFVGKVLRWAYEQNPHTPACPRQTYERLMKEAVAKAGLERVRAKFLGHDNAIRFLVDLRDLAPKDS